MRAPLSGYVGPNAASRHQAGHLGLGNRDLFAPKIGERDVLDDVIVSGGHGGNSGVVQRGYSRGREGWQGGYKEDVHVFMRAMPSRENLHCLWFMPPWGTNKVGPTGGVSPMAKMQIEGMRSGISGHVVGAFFSGLLGGAVEAVVTVFKDMSAHTTEPVVTLAAWLLAILVGAFCAIAISRYLTVLDAGASPDDEPERQAYERLRGDLAVGGLPARIYRRLLVYVCPRSIVS